MTTRNLDALFAPRAIALIGASNTPSSVGAVLARNLLESGFSGPILAVNPHETAIRSTLSYKSLEELPLSPDLAVVATPPASVPATIDGLARRGCRAAVVITAGFGEAGGAGEDLKQQMLEAARPALLRIVGPNCLGVISPGRGVNASFAQLTPRAGGLALVAQSGAVTTAALDWAQARGYGFSHIVTLGDTADVDFGDMLDFLALDEATHGILLYVESIGDARKFMTAARLAGRAKPVTVMKAGRSAAGAKAALSHTGALAGADAVYDAAFRRAGLLRVFEMRELFDAMTTLSSGMKATGERLAIISNGGGAGVLATDSLAARGGHLAELAPATIEALGRVLPAAWSKGDPVDIVGDAGPDRYAKALEAVLADPNADAVLVLNCPTAVADSTAAARAVIATMTERRPRRPLLTGWLGETSAIPGRALFAEARIPTHETPDEAARAFMHLVEHARSQALLVQAPAAPNTARADRERVRRVIDAARAEGRETLSALEAGEILSAYDVPFLASEKVATPEEAGSAAARLGGLIALKILSDDISHKSDVGGVALSLAPGAVEQAARAMLTRVKAAAPEARLNGFIVQSMAGRPRAHELIAGIALDPTFGPIILFGAGGVAVEVLADRAIGLPPLNEALARDMILRTRIAKLLAGYRDRPAADIGAIVAVLIALARLAADFPQIAELDINPLLADENGALALDGRIRLASGPTPRPAIRPYPAELEQRMTIAGEALTVRPLRPEDAAGLVDLVARTDAEDVRLRFRAGLRRLPQAWAERLSQVDYDREMALAAVGGAGEILGVARLAADPQGECAEFALLVRTDHQHRGIGGALMEALIAYAKGRGLRELWGETQRDNHRMLQLAGELGFKTSGPKPDADPQYVRMALALA